MGRQSVHIALFACALSGAAEAQPASPASPASGAAPDETIIIDDRAPRGGVADLIGPDEEARDRRRALAASSFLTIVHIDERAGETRGLAEAVGAAVGADARSLGGLGSFSSLAVRGAAPGHTQVLVDGVQLSRLGTTTVDLSRYELDGFEEIELYRGGVPITLGGAGVGGALNLVTRVGRGSTGERVRVSAGVGSFGARSARVRAGDGDADVDGGVAYVATVGYAGANGDFSYFDDAGTNLTLADDRMATRANNGFDELDAAVRVAGRRADLRWDAGARGLGKQQGLPGAAFDQAMNVSLDSAAAIADGGVTFDRPAGVDGLVVRTAANLAVEAQAFHDPDDEIGNAAQDRRYLTLAGGASSAAVLARGRHRGAAALELRGDYFRDREVGANQALRTYGSRAGVALAIADDIGAKGGRLAIEPALRLETLHTDPLADGSAGGMPVELVSRTETFVSPRLGVRGLVLPDLAVKATGGRYSRVPTALELFGDRGFILGSPDLRSEHGWVADAGVVWAPASTRAHVDRVYLEAAGFYARPRDPIVFVTTGGFVARPVNLPGARLRGVELVASARAGRTLTIAANYTLTDTRAESSEPSLDGKRLPGRPLHALYSRADVARLVRGRLAAVFADASFTSGSYLDDSNLSLVPARWLYGAGAKLEVGAGFTLAVEVKNLRDNRIELVPLDPPPRPDLAEVPRAVSDVAGYPLPGRAVYLRLDWSH
ncbi:MAG TPA: TonB-dependent receptor [Kofleriaceae bacterium]|nr:TonB-dependent receptor [Kofleriaceae bacterium]